MVTNPTSKAYFAEAERYLKRNYRIELREEIVRSFLGQPRDRTILDLGCGNGAVSLSFAAANDVILVDNSRSMLEAARAYAAKIGVSRYTTIEADAGLLSVDPVDIVIALGLFAHVDNLDQTMASIARALKPGGKAVIQFSDADKFLNRVGRGMFAMRGRNYARTKRSDIVDAARRHGLVLLNERTHLLILPGMPRLMGRSLLAYDRLVQKFPRLAAHGLDTLALFEKR